MKHATDNTQGSHRFLLMLMMIVICASVTASYIQRSGGRVAVMGIKIPTQNGQWLGADLFKPKTATAENPAPLVIVIPGFQRSKETLSNLSLELSRRGVVVIAIDPYAQGTSSSSMSRRAATTEGYGMFAVVNYAHDTPNLNYIDRQRIAATGHSAGGNAAIRGANFFGKQAKKSGEPSKLHSVFVSGYVLTLTNKVLRDVKSNVGVSYALYDEGAYRNELKNGDMKRAPEALRLINSTRPRVGNELKEVQLDHYYGNPADHNLRVIYNEPVLHPFQPYDRLATANQLQFFETVFELNSDIDVNDQVWYWKELMTLLSLTAAMLALVPAANLLLRFQYFQPLVHQLPEPLPTPDAKGRAIFWGLFTLSACIACFSYIPLAELSQVIFVDASSRKQTWFFPQRMNNAVLLWAVFNGSLGMLIFSATHYLHGRKQGVRREMWGANINLLELWRTLVLAIILFFFFFLLLFGVYYCFHVDYRFVFLGARVFQARLIPLLLMYAPLFFIFFFSNSLRVNAAMRFKGQAEWKSMLLAGIANTAGLILILVLQYTVFAMTGTVHWTESWLYVNLLFGVVPMMFVLPYFNRYFFRLTGRIYLGPMTTCLIFIMILLSNTVCYIPL